MYFAGTDVIVKMYNSPYPIPSISESFTFPATRLKVKIEDGNLMYTSHNGRASQSPVGFCSLPGWATMESCIEHGGDWTPYATLGNVTRIEKVKLNAVHLRQALNDMLDYYKKHVTNALDFKALEEWVAGIQNKIDTQFAWQPGIDVNARLIDAMGIQINSQQPVTPLYNTANPFMETYMRSNVMVQGKLIVNYSMDNKYPSTSYFKNREFDNIRQMVRGIPFMDDKALGELVMYGNTRDFNLSSKQHPILELTFARTEFDRYMGLNKGTYYPEEGTTTISLHEVRFISKNHSVTPSANNVVETYQFIARDII